jgi:hypothetical protein
VAGGTFCISQRILGQYHFVLARGSQPCWRTPPLVTRLASRHTFQAEKPEDVFFLRAILG